MEDKHIKPLFSVWCQKILPLVYDESLSYYEVLCKVQQKLNEVIKSNNNLQDEFYQLKEWIDTQLETYTKEQLQQWLNTGVFDEILEKLVSSVYVENYGAKGDGITDCTNAIQTAINENPTSKIRFKGGHYLISKQINIKNFKGLDIDLGGAVIFSNTNIDCIFYVGEANDVGSTNIIQNGTIDCNSVAKNGIILDGFLNFFSNLTILSPVDYGILDNGDSISPQKYFNNIYIVKNEDDEQYSENTHAVGMKLSHDCVLNNIHIGRFYKGIILTGTLNLLNNIHIWTQFKTEKINANVFNQTIAIEFQTNINCSNIYIDNFKYGFYSTLAGSVSVDNLVFYQGGVTDDNVISYIVKDVYCYKIKMSQIMSTKNIRIEPELNSSPKLWSNFYGDISVVTPPYNEPLQPYDAHDVVCSNSPKYVLNGNYNANDKRKIGELKIPKNEIGVINCYLKLNNNAYGLHTVFISTLNNRETPETFKLIDNHLTNNDYKLGVYFHNESFDNVEYLIIDIYIHFIVSTSINLFCSVIKLSPFVACLGNSLENNNLTYDKTGTEIGFSS